MGVLALDVEGHISRAWPTFRSDEGVPYPGACTPRWRVRTTTRLRAPSEGASAFYGARSARYGGGGRAPVLAPKLIGRVRPLVLSLNPR